MNLSRILQLSLNRACKSFAMDQKVFLLVCATALCIATAKTGGRVNIPTTRFTCQGRASGYYADIDTGCQVYHMCDGLGRQFSYSCPNTTLFQQRMLICDHWYMVNCTNSEDDYDANLLIGQRDKPFVSDDEMRLRTPRPDILSVPPNNYYYEGLKEAETKFAVHPDNSIADNDDDDSILSANNNDLDSEKPVHRPVTSKTTTYNNVEEVFTFKTDQSPIHHEEKQYVSPPSREFEPPFLPPTTTEADSEEFELDIRMKPTTDAVYNFIKRFDPNSPDSHKTSMSQSEIINLNKHLPIGPANSEEDKSTRINKNYGNNFNTLQSDKKKGTVDENRFDTANVKSNFEPTDEQNNVVPTPSRELLLPKSDYSNIITTTMGPPIYYEWKWAVPAFDLELPKIGNETDRINESEVKPQGKRPYSDIPRTTPKTIELIPSNTEYNISSYFVPDYVFPLDGAHPGYEGEGAQTSFQVQVARPGSTSYGENPNCPQCHPAYLKPGTCEPCIVRR